MFHSHAASHRQTNAGPAKAFLILVLALALGGLAGTTASAAPPPDGGAAVPTPANPASGTDPARGSGEPEVDAGAAEAMAHVKKITIAEAKTRLAREAGLGVRGAGVEESLRGRSGGIYLDTDGNLVVTTLDPVSNALVKRNGARARLVDDSSARLDAIVKQLDRQSSKAGAGAVQGWYVDIPTNSVVVTVTEGATDATTAAMTQLARSFGDSVRIEHRPAAEAPKRAEWMVGGFEFLNNWNGRSCSVGFNTLDASNRNVVLTAGHCVSTSGWLMRNSYWIGATRTANYPSDDFGTFWNQYPSYWQPSPSVYRYDGSYITLAGRWDNPPVGATVCKSGRTTGYTCGTIRALNQTVVYDGVHTLYGLVRHDACVEGGDSGGSNISAGRYALGVTSGASTRNNLCLSKYGSPNVSWYQPVGEALSRNGLRLIL